jgi:uncharacterized protein (DUF2267 family)
MAHLLDTVGCAIDAQDAIKRVRSRLRGQLKAALNEICDATARGCSCGTGLSDEDIASIVSRLDEDLDEMLADTMSDLDERAGGEG